MIHNTHHSMCVEDSAATGEVLLKKCNLDSVYQQWVWITQGKLMCVATSRCLSAQQTEPVQTLSCQGLEGGGARLLWDCDRDRLINRNTSMRLSADGQHLIVTYNSKQSKWRSLDEGDICQERLRLRRASGSEDDTEQQTGEESAMTEEEKEFLRWYYRTEDPTTWKFVLLGLAFVCLLVGFLLLGMGAMANKSRKKIAQYKAAASRFKKSGDEELQIISPLRDDCSSKPPPSSSSPSSPHRLLQRNGEVNDLRAGDIVVTWKDGNTSCLYSDHAPQVEQQMEEQVVMSAAELSPHDKVNMVE